jgi:hypothetical protein
MKPILLHFAIFVFGIQIILIIRKKFLLNEARGKMIHEFFLENWFWLILSFLVVDFIVFLFYPISLKLQQLFKD